MEAPDLPAYHRNASPAELKAIIRKHYASSAFNTCNTQKLLLMQGQPCKLFVNPKVKPFAIHKHRPVAIHSKKETRQVLDRDTDMGVIRPKLLGKPTVWCVPMHIIAKKSGKPRRVVDFYKLNQASLRQIEPTKALLLQCQSVLLNSKKTIFDAWHGYHSMLL